MSNCGTNSVDVDCKCKSLQVGHIIYPNYDSNADDILATDGNYNIGYRSALISPPTALNDSIARWDSTGSSVTITDSSSTISSTGLLTTNSLIASGLIYPLFDGTNGQTLTTNGSGNLFWSTKVESSTFSPINRSIVVYNGTSGLTIIDSSATIDLAGKITANNLQIGVINYPSVDGSAGQALTTDGSGNITFSTIVTSTPTIVPDNSVVRYDGTTGLNIQDSLVSITDGGNLITPFINSFVLPTIDGNPGESMVTDGSFNLSFVTRVNSSSQPTNDNRLVRFDGTTGLLIQDSVVNLTDTGDFQGSISINGMLFPPTDGLNGQVFSTDGAGNISFEYRVNSSSVPSNDNFIARYDGTTGYLIHDSLVSITDLGQLITPGLTVNGITYPIVDGTNGQVLTTNGAGSLTFTDKVASSSVPSINDSIVRYDGTTGYLIHDSLVSINDLGVLSTPVLIVNNLNYPSIDGNLGETIITDGSGNLTFDGRVDSSSQPATNERVAVYDGTTGLLIKDSSVKIVGNRLTTPRLTAANQKYPPANGIAGQVLTTDGTPDLFWGNPPTFGTTSLFGTLSTPITVNLLAGDHIVWDTQDYNNSTLNELSIDLTTTYTNLPNVDSVGRITLLKNSEYYLKNVMQEIVKTGNLELAWWNADTNVQIGQSINNNTATNNVNMTNTAYIDTTGPNNVRVELRIISSSAITSYNKCNVNVEKVNFTSVVTPPYFFQVDRVFSILTAPQLLNLSIGDHIMFDTEVFVNNTGMSIDTTTLYTTTLGVTSIGRFELNNGTHYSLEAIIQQVTKTGDLELVWYDASIGANIGYSINNSGGSNDDTFQVFSYFNKSGTGTTFVELRLLNATSVTSIDKIWCEIKKL